LPTPGDKTATQYLCDEFQVTELQARSSLGKFGISGPAAVSPLRTLSGGQRVRVSFAYVTWRHPQVLLLDEPTNHLDIGGIRALSEAIKAYEGGVVIVSHNRAFCNACCNKLWVAGGGAVRVSECSEEAPFHELFSGYAQSVLSKAAGGGGKKAASSASALPPRGSSGGANRRKGHLDAGAGDARTALL